MFLKLLFNFENVYIIITIAITIMSIVLAWEKTTVYELWLKENKLRGFNKITEDGYWHLATEASWHTGTKICPWGMFQRPK